MRKLTGRVDRNFSDFQMDGNISDTKIFGRKHFWADARKIQPNHSTSKGAIPAEQNAPHPPGPDLDTVPTHLLSNLR